MNQSADVQLRVSLRALKDVVAPILAEAHADKHAIEQLQLVIATLSFLKLRLPDARRFARAELRTHIALATGASDLAGGDTDLAAAIATADTVLADPEADTHDIETTTRALRDQVTAFYSRSIDKPFVRSLEDLILAVSGDHVDQCRLWCAPFGFEPKPETLPDPGW